MNLPFGSSIVRGYADILNLLATGLNSLFQRSVFPRVAVLCPITAGGDKSAKKKLQELKMKQESDKQKKAMELIMQSGKSWDEVIEMFK